MSVARGGRASINQSVVPGARRIGGHPSAVVTNALQLFTFLFSLSLSLSANHSQFNNNNNNNRAHIIIMLFVPVYNI